VLQIAGLDLRRARPDERAKVTGTAATRYRRDAMSEAHIGASSRGAIGCEIGSAAAGASHVLSLAAAPTFAIMAVLTGALGAGQADVLCSATQTAMPLNGMVVMYVLMSAFHSAAWLKLISTRVRGGILSSSRPQSSPL
jgi:hypothetical protein